VELIDTSRPEIAKAIDLARELVEHCRQHNFSEQTEVFGVAINANAVKEFAYVQGKNYEKDRIATLLGLSR
jgi:hypothetical protein